MIDSKIKGSIGLPSDEALSGRFNELCGYYTASLQSLQDEIEKKFVGKKEQTDILGAVYSVLDMENRSRRVLDCGSFLEFKVTEERRSFSTLIFVVIVSVLCATGVGR